MNYVSEAKEKYQGTAAWTEYKQRGNADAADGLMNLFAKLGRLKNLSPSDISVQSVVKEIQQYITDNFYTCTNEILAGLGKMYVCDDRFTENIDKAGGVGTAEFASKAIGVFCE